MNKRILTAESVTEGHPDKLCDLIADNILDECLRLDRNARVACEVMATAGKITVAGEISVSPMPDLPAIVCRTVHDVGYSSGYEVEILTHEQSSDISGAVDGGHTSENCSGRDCLSGPASPSGADGQLGAGDQGVVYGYATGETGQMLPLPVVLANHLTMGLAFARKMGLVRGLLPDGKALVSVEYDGAKPVRVAAVVVSCQHEADKDTGRLRREILKLVIEPALSGFPPDSQTDTLINPSGRFVLGGFEADTGLTGRKLMADTYGGLVLHGGGALSGKDATKIDRSGAYMARYAAKNVVAAGLARECTVCAAYAIGRALPLSVTVDTHGTGRYDDRHIAAAVKAVFDFTPSGMIRALGLGRPVFAKHCCYGHFMHPNAPWEQADKAGELGRLLVCILKAPAGDSFSYLPRICGILWEVKQQQGGCRMDTGYKGALAQWQAFKIQTADDLDSALQSFRVLFAYHSGKIENPDINYHDTREIFENGQVLNYTGDPRTLFEQQNQKLCYDFLKDKIVAKEPLTLPLVLEIHGILTAGTYDERRYILRGERPGALKKHDYVTGLHEVGYPPEEVEGVLIELLDEIAAPEAAKDPVLTAAYFHARFEYIHPFADGNGRVGRTLMNYALMIMGHPPLIVHDEDKKVYYDALECYDTDEDLEPLKAFIEAQTVKTWGKTRERGAQKPPKRKSLRDLGR